MLPASAVTVGEAYSARAQEYTDLFGTIDAVHPDDLALVTGWAESLDGPVLDAGCGPGQWTDHLRLQGVAVEGVDGAPAFVDIARERFPGSGFRLGSLGDLRVADGSLAGILSWYSVIHTPPGELPAVLAEFARCVRPGGGLALGFVTGEDGRPFDHAVTTAWFWSVPGMTALLADAGFEVLRCETRPGDRRSHGAIIASRGTSR